MLLKRRRGVLITEGDVHTSDDNARLQTTKRELLPICLLSIVVILTLILAVVIIFPSPIDSISYSVPEAPALEGVLAPNILLSNAEHILEGQIAGPESIVVEGDKLYTGLLTGEIIVVENGEKRVVAKLGEPDCESIQTCGRPLGMRMNNDGHLLVAEAYLGIFEVDPSTGDSKLLLSSSTLVNGVPMPFVNDLTIARDGTIYLTHVSTKRSYHQALECIMEGCNTGRVVKYDPVEDTATELVRGIRFANGIQLSPDENFLYFCEMIESRIWKYHLKGTMKGQKEIFIANLPGFVDNIRPSPRGGYWVALFAIRTKDTFNFFDYASTKPWIRNLMMKTLPVNTLLTSIRMYGLAIEISEGGTIVRSLHDPSANRISGISQITEHNGVLYLGSHHSPFLSHIQL